MWTPVEGRYGRTRDGRKVGPMERDSRGGPYPWLCTPEGAPNIGVPSWAADGRYDTAEDHPLDLVAEWVEDGPVRTVTRQEIVPGRYGHVLVDRTANDGASVLLGFRSTGNIYPETRSLFSADDLDAAARVLTQLAEALRNDV